jgi:autotransporter passenger strand-loop-strand repeat protein
VVRVEGGGRQIVSGLVEIVFVSSGGEQDVGRGGTAEATVIRGGGTGKVFSGGLALGGGFFGFTVNSGGVEIANSGGTTSAVAVASGGELIIRSGGTGIGSVSAAGSWSAPAAKALPRRSAAAGRKPSSTAVSTAARPSTAAAPSLFPLAAWRTARPCRALASKKSRAAARL